MTLITAADGAWPPNRALLPTRVKTVLAYIGQAKYTPHVWTPAECQGYRDAGYDVWSIWVPPQADIAELDPNAVAADTDTACQVRGIPKNRPTFFDVEYAGWTANPAGVGRFIMAWKVAMKSRGYPHPFGYVPQAAGFDWVAHWVGWPPESLPAGWVGQQYAHDMAAGAYDLSVFDTDRLGITTAGKAPRGEIEGQLDMFLIKAANADRIDLVDGTGHRHYVGAETTVDAMKSAGIPFVDGADPRDVANFPVAPTSGQ